MGICGYYEFTTLPFRCDCCRWENLQVYYILLCLNQSWIVVLWLSIVCFAFDYSVGGYDGHQCLDSVECYDPATNVWQLLPKMTTQRSKNKN